MKSLTELGTRAVLRAMMLVVMVSVSGFEAPVSAQGQSMTVPKSFAGDPKDESLLPEPLRELGFDPRLGEQAAIDLAFLDDRGQRVVLADLLGERPVLLAPVYFDCPMLCSMVLDGIVRGLRPLDYLPGDEFDVVAISFDPRETPEQAAEARTTTLARYRKPETADGWRFLVAEPGNEQAVAEVMDSIGFRYRYDEETELYAHAGGVVVLTPEGRISRYFYGVDYAPKDLKLSFLEAADGGIGSLVDQVLLFCYQYDPELGKYSAATIKIVRVAGVLTVVLLGAFLIFSWRRERRQAVAVA